MNKINTQNKGNTTLAYFGFMFQTFIKRPFGYVVAILYALYLAVILLIVPAVLHLNPLFIWSSAVFNIPIFNLFFIAAATSALAVSIFRTGVEDGTELSLSSKPLTKGSMVFVKTVVYLIIMLGVSMITIMIAALTKPIFGSDILRGITDTSYRGLLLSILVGNAVTTLFFGGVAVFISMVGGQVIIMVATIGVAFIMCLANVIFPLTVSGPLLTLKDKYSTSINSIAAPTMSQYNNTKTSKNISFAGIQCVVDSDTFEEVNHMDTNEYWTKANKESGISATNYIDCGKQLSNLYNSFGLDETKREAAQKLAIGTSRSSYYVIDNKSHVSDEENINNGEIPFVTYDVQYDRGVEIPVVNIFGGNTGLDKNNWGAISKLAKINFDSVITLTTRSNSLISDPIRLLAKEREEVFGTFDWRMSDLILSEEQEILADQMFNTMMKDENVYNVYNNYSEGETSTVDEATSAIDIIVNALNETENNPFFTGKWDEQIPATKAITIAKIQLRWISDATKYQIKQIDEFIKLYSLEDKFPYSSKTISTWVDSLDKDKTKLEKQKYDLYRQKLSDLINHRGINLTVVHPKSEIPKLCEWYVTPIFANVQYCETFTNMYKYKVSNFYNVYALIAIWSTISVALFTASIVVYKKTDFK